MTDGARPRLAERVLPIGAAALAAEATRPDTASQTSASVPGAPRRLRVLVVDDEPSVRSMMQRILRRHHDVETVENGREAMQRLRDGARYDAILSDLLMPDVTGMQLHARIEALDPAQARRMAFLTGGAFTPAARAFLDEAKSPVVMKPVSRERLLEVLEKLQRHDEEPG